MQFVFLLLNALRRLPALSRSQLLSALLCATTAAIVAPPALAQPRTNAEIKAMRMAAYDKNGDGKIEGNEVDAATWARLSLFDCDGDGVLSGTELDRLGGSRFAVQSHMGRVPRTFTMHEFTGTSGRTINYGLLSPELEDSSARFPLVLCLHGSGGEPAAARVIGADAMQQNYPCFVMAPVCDSSQSRWIAEEIADPIQRRVLADDVYEALEDVIATHRIDPDRVYITGPSMGGAGTWGLIVQHPERFAAAAPICGHIDPKHAPAIAKLPIWVFHNDGDPVVNVEASRRIIAALRDAGGAPRYTEFRNKKLHDSWTESYAKDKLWDWMFAQRRGQSADTGEPASE